MKKVKEFLLTTIDIPAWLFILMNIAMLISVISNVIRLIK